MNSPFQADVSVAMRDAAWDAFVADSRASYKQSSAWAEVKSAYDWTPARVTVSHNGQLVGGAQVLLRSFPVIGLIAFAPEAPVLAIRGAPVVEFILDELQRLAMEFGAGMLMVHPPQSDPTVLGALTRRGYRPTPLAMAPSTTSIVDLRDTTDVLLARMRPKTRQRIRKGMRSGVAVRQGNERDVDAFYRLHVATAQRKGLAPVYPERYFRQLWDAFRPSGSARIFLAACEGEVVSALFLLAVGDTVSTFAVAWSGRYADRVPNELLHWSAMQWAKASGYSFWNFSSIEPGATAVLDGGRLPDDVRTSTTFFKLGFGGAVVPLPETYALIFNPVLNKAYSAIRPILRSARVRKQIDRLRFRRLRSPLPRRRAS